MAMGKNTPNQDEMFAPMVRGAGHPFYEALNKLLNEMEFDRKIEEMCAPFYAADNWPGRRSVPPGRYFRMILIGYFEGIGSERGIIWRCADSMSLRDFLKLSPHQAVPGQSVLSRTRRRLPAEVFDAVFCLVLSAVDDNGLMSAENQGVDSTLVKANASMRNICRKDGGQTYSEYTTALAKAADEKIDDDSEEPPPSSPKNTVQSTSKTKPNRKNSDDVIRHDRKRKKTTSNKDWESPADPDARIARMKNGSTRLAYKPETVADVDSGAILALQVYPADKADTQTLMASLQKAQDNVSQARKGKSDSDEVKKEGHPLEAWHKNPTANVTADKGYHSVANLVALKKAGFRSYLPEKKQRGKRKFTDKGGQDAASAYHQNKARMTREKGKLLGRKRAEFTERPNQHLYDRGGLRELTLRGQESVQKRLLVQSAGFNLGLILRKRLGAGAPKWLSVLKGRLLLLYSRLLALGCLLFGRAAFLKLYSGDMYLQIRARKTGF